MPIARWLAAVLILLCGFPSRAPAQDYPTRPVRIVVGPGPDVLARVMAQKLSGALGRQFYVEPLPGAGGVIAAQTVAKAAPDGHTLLLTTGTYSIMEALQPNLPFGLIKDFAPVSLLGTLAFVLVAHPDVPARSVGELLELARAKPGSLNCASSGRGTTAHLGCEMLRVFGRVDITHVPFNGAAAAVNDLLGHHVDLMFLTLPQGIEYAKSGQLRALAVTGERRAPALSAVPTIAEAGLPQAAFVSWNGLHATGATPDTIVAFLNAELNKILKQPDVQQAMASLGLEPRGGSPQDFSGFLRADVEHWTQMVKSTGLRSE